MSKYIEAETLKAFMRAKLTGNDLYTPNGIDEFVDGLPAADVVLRTERRRRPSDDEVRHGRWIGADDDGVMYKCSVCGEWSCCRSPYCGECGAKMDEKSKCVECKGGYCEDECVVGCDGICEECPMGKENK